MANFLSRTAWRAEPRAHMMRAVGGPAQSASFSSTSGILRDARRRNSICCAKPVHPLHIIRCTPSSMRSDGASGCSIAREDSLAACSHEYINLLMVCPEPVLAHAGTQAQPRSEQDYV